ncbi:MAG: hypothetical protein ACTSPE_09225 [Candidatus Thorarchaeota archaeon]
MDSIAPKTSPRPHVDMVDRRGKIVDIEDEDVHEILEELIERVREKTGRDAKSLLVIIE